MSVLLAFVSAGLFGCGLYMVLSRHLVRMVLGLSLLTTAVNLMLFSLIHNPCSTTIYTIYKETGSKRWTAVSALLPLALGFTVTFFVAQIWRLVAGWLGG